jgi:hypothetical protein
MDKYIELAFSHFPEIETERLQLRTVLDSDAIAIWNMRKNDRVNEFIGREPMATLESAQELGRCKKNNKRSNRHLWVQQY